MGKRASGILLHISSLPSDYGIGDFGPAAFRFVDFLAEAKQSFWQILPLNPTDTAFGSSPYHSISAFAGNPLLISPEFLVREELLENRDLDSLPIYPREKVSYPAVSADRRRILGIAYQRFKKMKNNHEFEEFCSVNSHWLEDYCLFAALKSRFHGQVWSRWPAEIQDRKPQSLCLLKKELSDSIEMEKFIQFIFSQQWFALKDYANQKEIKIIGDIPIYVEYNSADLWVHPEIFKLDKEKRPYVVAGVPPDYFSKTGQLWGNPIYRWKTLKEKRYDWWFRRIGHNLILADIVRIDHFRGLVGYWEVPASENTAINGKWIKAPAADFFNKLIKKFSHFPIIAEDLGIITPDVKKIMQHFGFPGMKVLLFAFGEDNPAHPYLPHTYGRNCVVYTGTHDNNTVKGWFENEASVEARKRLFRYLGKELIADEVAWALIRLAMMSVADTVIFPMQDILGLGQEARMNIPATVQGNWQWRLLPEQLSPLAAKKLLEMTDIYGRSK